MRRMVVGIFALLVFAAAPAQAQDGMIERCAAPSLGEYPASVGAQVKQLCTQAVGTLADMQPSVGIAFSGGNPVLGTGNTLGMRMGMVPRVSVSARTNVAFVDVPEVFATGIGQVSPENPEVAALGTVGLPVPAIQGDVAVGVFNGLDIPTFGGLGSVDLLGSVSYVPQVDEFGLSEAITNVGVGARVGILDQGLVMPGVSVSGMYRRMGGVQFGDVQSDGSGDRASFAANLQTWNVRGVASKGLLMFDVAVGAGYDAYSSDVDMVWQLECSLSECMEDGEPSIITQSTNGTMETGAWNVFGNVALNVLMLNVVGELGYQKAMDRIEADDLSDVGAEADRFTTEELSGGRLFGSLGLRIAI